jgi:hypothetical protein
MKTFYKILPWVLLIIVCFLFWKSCQNDEGRNNVIDVIIPEQKGSFDGVKPEQTIVITQPTSVLNDHNTEALSGASKQSYEKDLLIDKLLRQNDSLSKLYAKKTDSAKTAAFNDAIAIREYKNSFEDSLVKIDLSGLVRGEIQSMEMPKYIIKEQKLPVQMKTWRLLGGLELGAKQTLDRFGAKANLRYQSAKGNLSSVGIDNNQMIWVGHDIQIFKHTKVK